jgi:multiple sugar transport system substrate-binding protein
MPNRKSILEQQLSRRNLLRLAGAGAGAAFLAACAPAATPTAAPTTAPATAAPATAVPAATAASTGPAVAIDFWTPGGSQPFCAGFDTVAADFMKAQPGITVNKVNCYSASGSYDDALQTQIAAGNPPDSTIIWTSPVVYAARGAALALDDLMASSKYSQLANWAPGVLASCQWKGKTYGLPATAGTYGIYYNADAFAAKGIPTDRASFPKTWDDFKKLSAEFVQWNGDTLVSAGFMPWTDPQQLNIWSALNGGQLFDSANQKYTIDSDQNIAMMQYALDWLNEQYKGDWTKVQASDNWDSYADGQGRPPAFQGGKLIMHSNGFWLNGDMYNADFKGWSKWDVAQFPVGPSGTKTASGFWPNWLILPKGSKHPAEAFKYLDYIAGEGIKVWFSNIPDLPANKQVPTTLIPKVVVDKRGQDFATDVTNFFRKQMDVVTPMWTSPVQAFSDDQMQKAAAAIISKTTSPKDALGAAQKASQAELERVLKGG